MKNIEEINQANVKKIAAEKKLPEFYTGDIVKVGVRITEGKRDRIQYFEGVCIAKKNRDINSSFTVRKVRRAKLYYLRDRTGKSARIAEKIRKKIGIDVETKPETVNEENVAVSKEEKIVEKETPSTETAKKVEKKTETPKAESPKENLKDKK